MPAIELQEIENFACRKVSLAISQGEMVVLLGPNGAGKTTLLNVIAGLVSYTGKVLFDGQAVDSIPARMRKVGYVFQDLALFPHLNVLGNITFCLRSRGWERKAIAHRVGELTELLGISHLGSRYPARLSGGEKQRVALARALAANPGILLLDEPFSSLDPESSDCMRRELAGIQQDLGTTTIFVTHDLSEAEQIADRVAVMQDGHIDQVGRPAEVLFAPVNDKIADYIGAPNILECQANSELGHGLAEVVCKRLRIVVPHHGESLKKIAILPRDVELTLRPPSTGVNVFEGVIEKVRNLQSMVRVTVGAGGASIEAEMSRELCTSLHLDSSKRVFVRLNMMKIKTCGQLTRLPP